MTLTPFYADDNATLYRGDALAVLRDLPDASVDALITDPPYSSGGMVCSDRTQDVHSKYVQTGSANHNLTAFTGDNRDQRAYAYWCALWLTEALRVVKPGGACALFTDWRQLPTTTDVLQAGGWVWRGIVPWHKPNGRMTQGRYANSCEYAVWGTNGPRSFEGYETLPGFFVVNSPREREHITQKPLEVMRPLAHIVPLDGVILDPFAGSGTTGVAALSEGRRFIGVEMTDHYCQVAARRLSTAAMRPTEDQLDLLATRPGMEPYVLNP